MKPFILTIFVTIIFFSWNVPDGMTQFLGAEVQEFRKPVRAPGFQLKKLNGGKVSLRELRGKVVLLNFFTTW